MIFEKKSYWTQSDFLFSLKNFSETFLILRRNDQKIYIEVHVKNPLFLSDFNEI
jgi:hypothetical protein